MNPTPDKLVDAYLKRLESELGDLPRSRRNELVDEISEHIAEARSEFDADDELAVCELLNRLGEPEEIAAETRDRFGVRPRSGALDVAALILLLIGGIILPVVGWIVGVVLLWMSRVWTDREKLLGTLVVPGGLALPFFVATLSTSSELCSSFNGGPVTCSGGPSLAHQIFMIVPVVAPIVTTVFLARRRGRATAAV
jgi:hypothetical protein